MIVCPECKAVSEASSGQTCPSCHVRLDPSVWGVGSGEDFLEWQLRLRELAGMPPPTAKEAARLRSWLADPSEFPLVGSVVHAPIRELEIDTGEDLEPDAGVTAERRPYPALRTMASLYRLSGWVILLLGSLLITGVATALVVGDWSKQEVWVLAGTLFVAVLLAAGSALTSFAAGEVLLLAVSVAEDTKRTSELTAGLVDAVKRGGPFNPAHED